jgi:two-component system sensor histidine kinase YesM
MHDNTVQWANLPCGAEKMALLLRERFLSWFRSSIKAKLTALFILSAAIPILLLAWFVNSSAHQVIMRKEAQYVYDKLAAISTQLDAVLTDMAQVMADVLANERLSAIIQNQAPTLTVEWFYNTRAVDNVLHSAAARIGMQVTYTILTAQGQTYGSAEGISRFERMDGALASRILASEWRMSLFGRQLPDYVGTQVITMGKTIKDQDKIVGIIFADLDDSWIDGMFSFLDSGALVFLLGQDGDLLYSKGDRAAEVKTPETFLSGQEVRIGRTVYLCSTISSAGFGIKVVSLTPLAAVFQDSSQVLLRLLIILAVVLVQTLLFARLFSNRFSSAILTLNSQVQAFGERGGRGPIVRTIDSRDEVGQLAHGVHDMSVRIAAMMDTIHQNEREVRRLEIAALQSQINPHMIYNTLNTITYMAKIQGVSNIEAVTAAFGKMLRLLSKTDGDFLTVRQEIIYIESYLVIKKYQLLCNLQTDFQVDDDAWDKPILKLILQPFVENAVNHGLSRITGSAMLTITIRLEAGSMLCARVLDNGAGMDAPTLAAVLRGEKRSKDSLNSVGIANTVERLRLHYGESFEFDMQSGPGRGTAVTLRFPAGEGDGNA